MSTRGIIGVRIAGVDKITYNHSDSYPDYLGKHLYEAVKSVILPDIEKFKKLATDVKMVESEGAPTAEEISKFKEHFEQVSSGTVNEYYALLRGLQGDLVKTLESGLMIEYSDFAYDSLFCEWGYIVNFDDLTFETYKGFQSSKRHKLGRFGANYAKWAKKHPSDPRNPRDYGAIALVHTQQLTKKMPTADAWLKKIVELTADKEA